MKDFRNLQVWAKAHQLTLDTYRATGAFPRGEQYGLTNQIRRCAASIAANIAEACGRNTETEFARFLEVSMGSASELEYYFLLARDLRFLDDSLYDRLNAQVIEVKQMLAGLIVKVRPDSSKRRKTR